MKTIFAVFGVKRPDELRKRIEAVFPGDHVEVDPGQWLVAATGTAQIVSDQLGITDGTSSPALVVAVSGYYGRRSPSIWEWIKNKWGQETNA